MNRLRNHLIAAAVLTALAAGANAQNVVSGTNGKIAFDRDGAKGTRNIWVMNPDGTGQTQLTKNQINSAAAWSPDGTTLAFPRSANGIHFEIYLIRADGTGLTQLTSDLTNSSFQPTWSPDGSKIAFAKGPDGGGTSDIYVMNRDGTGITNLTNDPAGFNISPAWSPDGTMIAFDSARAGSSEDIWVMHADGSVQTNLTALFVVANDGRLSQERWPAWSPDSSKIAFYTNADGCGGCPQPDTFHIYTMNNNGNNPAALTTGTYLSDGTTLIFDLTPTWSPDGTTVAFSSNRNGNPSDIYVVSATGGTPTDLSNSGAGHADLHPNWAVVLAPCGKKVCH